MSGLSHCEQVKRLSDCGATLIQLREKIAAPREFFDDARDAIHVAQPAHVKLIINDRVDIALALKADGVHLGQTDMPVAAARRVLGNDAIIGYSTHNIDQVRAAVELPIDYLAFGPVFVTASKANPDPVAGLSELARAKQVAGNLPLVAIGGIAASHLRDTFDAGADAAATISAVLLPPSEIAENFRKLTDLALHPAR